ncbi:histone-lysine N-methyltransferase family member SUVH9-like [Dioscorea cayenensis subsp. rotundata]|uniref:Histone-lysine N-methyltransferase family member SUVH9-like n=1 Tax=Dioscorea cayennensis subsp. rotundata TaxID=55577 RepID=A0AB40CH83_DIOCR|nr:histone-lysine N-methyltransferase family member SUVH9-like [Dioscorea cayenensis subsp. rotundata]XP_039138919.1 histone-lysine N-methyltransferase family member SUVH9-like [Dioscorea cayenensis subsp. rotundata]
MDPPPPSPFPDLNLNLDIVPFVKLEPKEEPLEDLPIATASTAADAAECLLSPEEHTPLQKLSPSEDALFAEYLRLTRLFLSSIESGASGGAIVPADGSSAAPASSAIVASKKRKARSSEMVRVSSLGVRDQIHFRDLVRHTRITFESLRFLLLRNDGFSEVFGRRTRPDLKAAALMTDKNLWLNRDKRIIGPIPGVCIGDVFFFRMELCVLGLHGQVQAGIDYVPSTRSPSGEPVATSIIVSGGYEDDDDGGEELIYTGHGGRDRNNFRHSVHQKLEGGNLALEKSRLYGIEIRVIRGIKSDRSPTNKVYVYDGLYKVVDSWFDTGKSGFGVFKYRLVRIEGQEEMGTGILKLAEELKVNPLTARPRGYLSLDISMKKEKFPVMLFNDMDDERDPVYFEYLARPLYPPSVFEEKSLLAGGNGCDCVTNCSTDCLCARLNGGELPYDSNGLLSRGKPLIYECGTGCRCPPSCPNRVSQKGLKHQLEIFRSKETGWGIRSLDMIRAGSFVCEYTGIVLTKEQTELLAMSGAGLVWPNRFPARWMEWGDISDVFPGFMQPSYPALPELNFSIDVSRTRNVASYLSHSSTPNVFLQCVLFDHYNTSYPHLMIFAMENIPPLRELSIDYGIGEEWVAKLTV